jgi:hypothetical protein
MADKQHGALSEADGLHEPKGVSTASADEVYVADGAASGTWESGDYKWEPVGVDAASAGDVYVADGVGGGTWSAGGGSLFGDMDFSQNTVDTTISATSASPGAAGWVVLNGSTLTTPGPLYGQGVVNTVAFLNDSNNERLQVPVSGIYEISFNASFSGGGGGLGNVYRFNFAIDGVENTAHAYALRQTSSSDVGNVGFSEYVQLSANAVIQPTVANQTATNNPTVEVSSFTCVLLKEL